MRSSKFKLIVSLLSLLFWIVPCLAQNPTITSRLDLKNQASAPSNPDNGFSTVYVTNTGVVRVRLSDGTDVPVLTGSIDTDDVAEGSTNLYFTNTRARSALSAGTGISYNSTTGEISLSGGGGGGALSALTAATASNDINNANNSQIWRWNTLAGATGLQLASSSTAAASNLQKLLALSSTGANANSSQTTYGLFVENQHTGTSSTNIAAYFAASGATNNYAGIFSGRVGVNTTTPLATGIDLGTAIDLKKFLLYGLGNTYHGLGLRSGETTVFYPTGSQFSVGAISTADGSTFTERVRINDSSLNLIGSSQNLLFQGLGAISFTSAAPSAKIDFQNLTENQAILLFKSGNTRHGIGIGSSQTRIFAPTNGYTSIGAISTSDGSTFTEYYRFNQGGKLDVTQGTLTFDQPFINQTATWNNGGVTFHNFTSNITDTASASASTLFRYQVGGTNKIYGRKDGYFFGGNGFIGNYAAFYDHVAFGYIDFAGSPSTDAAFIQVGSVGSAVVNTKSGGEIVFRYGGSDRAKLENSGNNWDFSVANNYLKVKQLATTVNNAGNSGTALTINWNNGAKQYTSLTGNVTLTLSNPVVGTTYTLTFIQDGTGTRTVTWPASVKWSGGSAPTITTGAGKTSIVRLEYAPDGTTNYYGTFTLDYN